MRTLCLFLSILCLSPGMAFSAERAKVVVSMTRPLTTGCVLNAARVSGMPPAALFGLLATEGGSMGRSSEQHQRHLGPGLFSNQHRSRQ